jgi:hypothetical protein
MKKIIFFLFSTFFISTAFTQNYSNLTIGTTHGANLKIRFAGKQYTLQDPKVTFQTLNPGTYGLTIYQWQNKNNGEWIEVFNNNITLTAYKHMEIMVLRFGKVSWDEGYIVKDTWNESYQNPQGNNQTNRQTNQAASDEQFQQIKKAITNEFSDADKLRTAKVILKNNLLNTTQIRSIMKLFFSDNEKLQFAKFAYDYCTDKGSYFTLGNEFFSSGDKDKLMDFINSK